MTPDVCVRPGEKRLAIRLFVLIALSLGVGFLLRRVGFTFHQTVSTTVLLSAILGTLLFWEIRLAVVFVSASVLFLTRVLTIKELVAYSSLDVILFLVGMMILVAALEDMGLFAWLTHVALHQKKVGGRMMMFQMCILSGVLSCVVDEVTSMMIMLAIIFQLCSRLNVGAVPFVISSVLCTNVGSTGTMLGNPIGILIGLRAGLTFEDFIFHAFPLMLFLLVVAWLMLSFWFRKEVRELDARIKLHLTQVIPKAPRLSPAAVVFLVVPLALIGLHNQLELAMCLEKNTFLVLVPLVFAGIIMFWKKERVQTYIETKVDWSTLLFFIFLFILAETLGHTGVAGKMGSNIVRLAGDSPWQLIALVLLSSGILSAFLDNIIVVASFIPVISSLGSAGIDISPLWWALLFGGCLGGNITMIGSTANICALGALEKNNRGRVTFWEWLKVGLPLGLVTMLLAVAALALKNI
ncbi:MAG: SLC13 family permease [Planctomycetota bacterium]|nr:SLC13 family permease [Planctomycetota bacterium]